MKRLLVYVAIVIVAGIALIFVDQRSVLFSLVAGILIGFLVPTVDATLQHLQSIRFAWMAVRYWRKSVRVSISYLYQIERQGKYLLIKGRRYDQFQPVGGVFKVYPAGQAELQKIGALNDTLYPIDPIGVDDLRIRVAGRHLVRLFEWFHSRRGRETDVWREFREELIAPGHLSDKVFKYVRAEYLRSRDTGVRWSDWAQSYEIVFAEIYKLVPTSDQERELTRLQHQGDTDLRWVEESEIRRRGLVAGSAKAAEISAHSAWII